MEKNRSKLKKTLTVIGFCLVLLILLSLASRVFREANNNSKTYIDTFKAEAENTIDALYLGNSGVYRFWQPPLAYGEYGITVMHFSTPSQPCGAIKYCVEEALKTQSPKLLIIDVRSFVDDELSDANMHNIIDFFPESWTKLKMTLDLCAHGEGFSAFDAIGYLFPVFDFHERWQEISLDDYEPDVSRVKGANTYSAFLNDTQTEYKTFSVTDARDPVTAANERELYRLLDYLEKTGIEALFVASPMLGHAGQKAEINYIGDILTAEGWEFINFNDEGMLGEVGISVSEDFMDGTHTNIKGSIKFTSWLAAKLISDFGLAADHRGDEKYASWDEAREEYDNIIEIRG